MNNTFGFPTIPFYQSPPIPFAYQYAHSTTNICRLPQFANFFEQFDQLHRCYPTPRRTIPPGGKTKTRRKKEGDKGPKNTR